MTTEITHRQTRPSNVLQTFVTIFMEPARAFVAIGDRPMFWVPLITTTLATTLLSLWYFNWVDFNWLQQYMLQHTPTMAARDAALRVLTRPFMIKTTLISAFVATPIIYLFQAVYFLLIGKLMRLTATLSKWYGLIAWSSLPAIILFPLGAIQILSAHAGELSPSQINPISLNQLIFHLEPEHSWSALLDNIDLITFWKLSLMIVGFKTWSGRSWLSSALVATFPSMIFYGGWIATRFF